MTAPLPAPPRRLAPPGDVGAALVAAAAAAGCLAARPIPAPPAVVWALVVSLVVAAAALSGRGARGAAALLSVAAALSGSVLAAAAWDGLREARTATGPVAGVATLVDDPVVRFGEVRAIVRLPDGRHAQARATGRPAEHLGAALAGERIRLTGSVAVLPPRTARRLAHRHVAIAVRIETASRPAPGAPHSRVAAGIRRLASRGAAHLPEERAALLAGLALGDDRRQPDAIRHDFRAAGLGHLLAVSGQNVALALALAAPLLDRLAPSRRAVAGAAVLLVFGTLTRWEPSVSRATAMAAVSLVAGTAGRPATTVRRLSLATAACLLADPLLVHALGFRLSVAACAGLATLERPIRCQIDRRLPALPAWLRTTLAAGVAAQAGVAPVALAQLGAQPLVTVPAGVAAVPAAGVAMVWGLAAAPVAALLPGWAAHAILLPAHAAVAWVALVARLAAAVPAGNLTAVSTAGAVALAAMAVAVRPAGRRGSRAARWLSATAVAALLLPPPLAAAEERRRPLHEAALAPGASAWRAEGSTVVVLRSAATGPWPVLQGLRRAGATRIEVLVVASPSTGALDVAEDIAARHRTKLVLIPPGAAGLGGAPGVWAAVPETGAVASAGPLEVRAHPADGGLAVEVRHRVGPSIGHP